MNKASHHLTTAARVALGLIFVVFGLNGFLRFLPMPEPPPEAGALLGAMAASGYLLPLLKATEVAVGVLLIAGRWVPLALTVLAPITVNIVAFNLFLKPSDMPMSALILGLHLVLAWRYRASFKALIEAKARPARKTTKPDAALREQRAAG